MCLNKAAVLKASPAGQRGFTLVEVALVTLMIAILASFAIPSYREYLVRGCRTDAMVALEEVANGQAQFYFDFNQYASTIALLPVPVTSPEGHYTLSTASGGDTNTYMITAIPSASSTCLPNNDLQYRVSHTSTRQHKADGGSWQPGWD